MSPDAKRQFEAQWPLLERRAKAFLARKRIPACDQEDLLQETAVRLLGMWDSIDQSRALWPLTSTIVLNLIRDRSRCAPRHDVVALLPEVESPQDVERTGLARIELDRVRRAMRHLSTTHRSVLMQEIHWSDQSVATPAEKMLRMRARRKLRSILEKVSGLVVLRARRLFELGDKVFALRDGAVTTASCVLCLVLGAGGVLVTPSALTPKASARPAPANVRYAAPYARTAVIQPDRIDRSVLRERVAEARREQAADRQRDASKAASREKRKGSAGAEDEKGSLLPSVPVGDGDGQIPVNKPATVSADGGPQEVTPPDPGDAPTVEPPTEAPAPPPPPGEAATVVRPLVEAAEELL